MLNGSGTGGRGSVRSDRGQRSELLRGILVATPLRGGVRLACEMHQVIDRGYVSTASAPAQDGPRFGCTSHRGPATRSADIRCAW